MFLELLDFIHPAHTFAMVQIHQFLMGPVHRPAEIGYLLINPLQGVAYDPPGGGASISNACPHRGHVAAARRGARPLMRLYIS